MAERFGNKYRVPSARLNTWDYGTHAAYFVTICTAGHEPYFWEIVDHDHVPSNHSLPVIVETPCMASLPTNVPMPKIAETPCMASLPLNQPVPPNHPLPSRMQLSALGKIVETEWLKTPELRPDMKLILGKFVVMPDHFHGIIIIGNNEYNRPDPGKPGAYGPQRKNLGSVIRGFKSAVTIHTRKNGITFGWQTRFYDRIIRDDPEFRRIEKYIEDNPAKWMDKHGSD